MHGTFRLKGDLAGDIGAVQLLKPAGGRFKADYHANLIGQLIAVLDPRSPGFEVTLVGIMGEAGNVATFGKVLVFG